MGKAWVNKLLKAFGIKNHKGFNFESYIQEQCNFSYLRQKDDYRMYSNIDHKLYLIINFKKEEVLIYKKDKMLSKINFIPKGSLFVDLWVNQVIANFNKDATEQK